MPKQMNFMPLQPTSSSLFKAIQSFETLVNFSGNPVATKLPTTPYFQKPATVLVSVKATPLSGASLSLRP
jgi:hypothetical protein